MNIARAGVTYFAVLIAFAATSVIAEGKPLAEPVVEWAMVADFAGDDPHDPLVVGEKVIVGTDKGEVRAHGCRDGAPVWVHEHGARIFHRPSSDGKYVFVSSEKGVAAIDLETGHEEWNWEVPFVGGPTLAISDSELLIVAGTNGILYAMDAINGEPTWECDFMLDAPPDPPGFDGKRARASGNKARPSAIATDGEVIYLSVFDQCRVIAVHATTGLTLWSFQTKGWVFGSAVAGKDRVFIGSQDDSFYCLDKETGEKLWSFPTKGRIESGGGVDQESVYFASCDGHLYCLNQANGDLRWKFAVDRGQDVGGAIYSVPIMDESTLYFAAGEGQAYAVDKDSGKLVWKVRPSEGSELYCSPATDGSRLFFTTRARDKERGEPSLLAIGMK